MTISLQSTLQSTIRGFQSTRRARLAAGASSFLLLALAGLGGASVFPFMTGIPAVTGAYRPAGAVPGGALTPGATMMVYDVMSGPKTRRSGAATVRPDGALNLTRYDGHSAPKGKEEAVLMPANVRALWVLATDQDRDALHRALNDFAVALGDAARQALTSPEFEGEYRPALAAAVRRAGTAAWSSKPVQDALDDLIKVSRPAFNRLSADTLRPVMMERLQPAVWATVKDNTARLLDVFNGFQFDFGQMERAATAALSDPRVMRAAEEAAGVVAGTPQMRTLMERYAAETAYKLSKDRDLSALLGRMMSDGRLADYLTPLGDPALALARVAPRSLAQLDEHSDLNSMAADIFKGQARGQSGHLVVFMSPAERRRLQTIDPSAAVLLVGEPAR